MTQRKLDIYECVVPDEALILPSYDGTPEQVEELRTALRKLVRGNGDPGAPSLSMSKVLKGAGLNLPGGLTYDQSALARFLDGQTIAPNTAIGAELYRRWVADKKKINLSSIENVFYHAMLIALHAKKQEQETLSRLICGYYFFYKRSALNPDFFIRGLLSVRFRHGALHVTETQYHPGGDGIPEMEEIDQGYAVMNGNIIYMMTRSNALKGATVTIINNHPIRSIKKDDGDYEELSVLYGFQIGGREYTQPTFSPYAAERITTAQALTARKVGAISKLKNDQAKHSRARRDREKDDMENNNKEAADFENKNFEEKTLNRPEEIGLGFCREVPVLLERHFR